MKLVAIVSSCGGVGRSLLTAGLADVLHRRGRPVLAVDIDPHNDLALHLGATARPAQGLINVIANDADWRDTALVNSDGVQFVPTGEVGGDLAAACAVWLGARPGWLRRHLDTGALPADAVVLVDTPPLPSPLADHVIGTADRVLAVLGAEPISFAGVGRVEALHPGLAHYVVNGLEPNRPLQNDIRLLLRRELGARLVPYAVHRDGSVADALARNRALLADAPGSQAAADLQLLASWLLQSLETPA